MLKIIIACVLFELSLFSSQINIDNIVKKAYNSNKGVILYLHRVGCSYCNSMEEFTLDDDEVVSYIEKNYVFIEVNISHKDTITYHGKKSGGICLAKNIGYDFYPSTLFLDKNANIEYASVGYKDESEFLTILQYVHKKMYNKMSLSEYKKSIGFKKDTQAEIVDPRKHAR